MHFIFCLSEERCFIFCSVTWGEGILREDIDKWRQGGRKEFQKIQFRSDVIFEWLLLTPIGVFFVNLKHIRHLFLMFPLLTLDIYFFSWKHSLCFQIHIISNAPDFSPWLRKFKLWVHNDQHSYHMETL